MRLFPVIYESVIAVDQNLEKQNIRFILTRGEAEKSIPLLTEELDSCLVVSWFKWNRGGLLPPLQLIHITQVCDFSPLRIGTQWRSEVGKSLSEMGVPFHEVSCLSV